MRRYQHNVEEKERVQSWYKDQVLVMYAQNELFQLITYPRKINDALYVHLFN